MCGSILLLSKISHQMWCRNHPLSQRNRTIEKTGGRVGSDREGVGQNLKKERGGNKEG